MTALRDRSRLRPLVVTWHNAVIAPGPRGLMMRMGQRLVARGADLTLGASSDLVELAKSLGARKAQLAPVAAPAMPTIRTPRADVRHELGIGNRPMVLTVGPAGAAEGLPDAAVGRRAGSTSPPRTLSSSWSVTGRYGTTCRRRIDAEQLPVRLLGHRNDVADLLGAADVFLLTSHWEARALVIQEAMQVGVPVVATGGGRRTRAGRGQRRTGVPGGRGRAGGRCPGRSWPSRRPRTLCGTRGRELSARWMDEDAVAKNLLDIYAGLVATGG
jgi:hypothetical protein